MLEKIKNKLGKDANLKELLSGSAITFLLKISGMLLSYMVIIFIAKAYGAEGVGVYSLILSLMTFLAMASSMGLNFSLLRFVGQFNKSGEQYKLRLLYVYALQLALPLSILISVGLYCSAEMFALKIFKNPDYLKGLRLASIGLPFFVLLNINVEYIRGLKLLRISEYFRSVNRPLLNLLLMLLLTSFMALDQLPIYTLVFSIVATGVLSIVPVATRVRKLLKGDSHRFTKKELLTTSLPMLVTSIASFLLANIALYLLEFFSTSQDVGLFSVAQKISLLVSLIVTVVNTMSAPKFSELYWAHRHEELQRLVKQSSKFIFTVSLVLSVLIAVISVPILSVFGSEFVSAQYALLMLIAGQMVNAMSGSVGIFMNMTGRQKALRNIALIACSISLLLSTNLIPIYGANGAAFSMMFATMTFNVIAVVYVKRKTGFITYYLPYIAR